MIMGIFSKQKLEDTFSYNQIWKIKGSSEGVLLAQDFSLGIDVIMKCLNNRKDANGQNYNFMHKKWIDEDIKTS